MGKTVFVSGCFDLLHSGHIAFLQEAASYGRLHVGIGSDVTVQELKGQSPVLSQQERAYMLEALQCVWRCTINSGSGHLDFEHDLRQLNPDLFIVNSDGHSPDKEKLCSSLNIDYLILERVPESGLVPRSTTDLRTVNPLPYRVDLAGGWLDQPYVSTLCPGAVITTSIEPTYTFIDRGGMATSTRKTAYELWPYGFSPGNQEKQAKILFSYENSPGTTPISGSQDALGLVLPGINRLIYPCGGYWPVKIDKIEDKNTLIWLEKHLYLVELSPRPVDFDVFQEAEITKPRAEALSNASDGVWDSLKEQNLRDFGHYMTESFYAQTAMFPAMVSDIVQKSIDEYRGKVYGWKVSGAGGGGYLAVVSEGPVQGGIPIKIRRNCFI